MRKGATSEHASPRAFSLDAVRVRVASYLELLNKSRGVDQIVYEPSSRSDSDERGGRYVQFAADGSDFGPQCIKLGQAIEYAAKGAAEYYRSKGVSGAITISNLLVGTMLLCNDPACCNNGRVAVVAKFAIVGLPPTRDTPTTHPPWQKTSTDRFFK